ncbi:WecB/TagA/CpsF family glycosyltransferase [Paenibacillus cellulositrophicus]|uniref:WecB/TagA/CpsF family glycosyltransferase n=1 Tax=Paenibacillus cellulositrophicus TaxID=562959 RepID=UPI00204219A8|nr:WecB/TagA/CpsF family glycosyltransferase [Paenibacillus cellulositrophicus]MCM2996628.1 WecB/TagA/CpsF family glycosyltransferase [Paenibacillus cellulositrophicus]
MQKYSTARIADSDITAINFRDTVSSIENIILNRQREYICVCNTHSVVMAGNDATFQKALDHAAICTPDGMPIVWALKLYGYSDQDRVDGPNLTLKLCELSMRKKYRLFLYGGKEDTLMRLRAKLEVIYPGITISGSYSPPFRKLTELEDSEVVNLINSSQADIVFVSLGCPKQELWMYEHRDQINGVMIGVGAAFDYIVGNIKRPPLLFQRLGLEWLFRLLSEPRRLWARYAYNNPVYIYRFIKSYKRNKKYTLDQRESLNRGSF